MALLLRNDLILPIVKETQIPGQVSTYNEARNAVYQVIRSRLYVSENNAVAENAVINAVDVFTVKNSTGNGVSVIDQRMGEARYNVSNRLAVISGGPQENIISSPVPFKLQFDAVPTPGLGITEANLFSVFPTAVDIPVPDTGIYTIKTVIEFAAQPALPDVISAYRIETRRSAGTMLDPPEAEIVSSVQIVRNPSDPAMTVYYEGMQLFEKLIGSERDLFFVQVNPLNILSVNNVVPIDAISVTIRMLSSY